LEYHLLPILDSLRVEPLASENDQSVSLEQVLLRTRYPSNTK